MMNLDLTFLEALTLAENEPEPKRLNPREKVPTNGADLRLFADGSVFPSLEFVEQFNLEYSKKEEESNALDLFDSHLWGNYPKEAPRVILLGVTDRSNPKTDLFSLSKYNSTGTPISSVLSQGASNYKLLDLVNEIYGEEWKETDGFIDLTIVRSKPLTTNNGIYYVPKLVTRGKNKGEITTERREYTDGVYVLVPFHSVQPDNTTVVQEPETETTSHDNL